MCPELPSLLEVYVLDPTFAHDSFNPAFTSAQKPTLMASSAVCSKSEPRSTGTPAAAASSRATCLSAKSCMVRGVGPSHAMPACMCVCGGGEGVTCGWHTMQMS